MHAPVQTDPWGGSSGHYADWSREVTDLIERYGPDGSIALDATTRCRLVGCTTLSRRWSTKRGEALPLHVDDVALGGIGFRSPLPVAIDDDFVARFGHRLWRFAVVWTCAQDHCWYGGARLVGRVLCRDVATSDALTAPNDIGVLAARHAVRPGAPVRLPAARRAAAEADAIAADDAGADHG